MIVIQEKCKFNYSLMKITEKKTFVSDILKEYFDNANIRELFGIKRAGAFGFHKF
jgi:hypothetical protein